MAWWRKKVVSPARRAWAAVSTRVRARNAGSGGSILKLHEDVQTCGYRDVQVMFDTARGPCRTRGPHVSGPSPRQMISFRSTSSPRSWRRQHSAPPSSTNSSSSSASGGRHRSSSVIAAAQ